MTDLSPIQPAGGPGGADPAQEARKGAKSPQGPSFAHILEEAQGAERAAPPGGGPAAGGVQPPHLGPAGAPSPARQAVHALSERFFALVESLRTQLGNPKASLKDIAPLIRDLELHRDRVLEELPRLPHGDPGRSLLEEMATLATAESARFRRGDYI